MLIVKIFLVVFFFSATMASEEPKWPWLHDIKPFLNMKYKLASTTGDFDGILKSLGISWVKRKFYEMAKPTVELTLDRVSGLYTFHMHELVIDKEWSFKPGQSFQDNTIDGRNVRESFNISGDELVETQEGGGHPSVKIVRKFSKDNIIVTVNVNEKNATRVYNRVP